MRGLDINGFASGAAILIDGASATGNWIYSNELGTDPTGSEAVRNLYGVQLLDGASVNTIGTNDVGPGGTGEGNLISGNLAAGVQLAGSQFNWIAGNLIGTDATGTRALANGAGIEITAGAYDNTVGGASAADSNFIAFNSGPGVVVEGDGSLGNQVTANRMYSNDGQGALQFDGSTDVSLPANLVQSFYADETIEASFETTSGGVILGYEQSAPFASSGYTTVDALYVGTDGKLYGDLFDFSTINSTATVDDGRWHEVSLVEDGASGTLDLYLDGVLVAAENGIAYNYGLSFDQIGTGYTSYSFPNTPSSSWDGFVGQIADVRIWSHPLSAEQVEQDLTTAPPVTSPGLVADYPLDDGHGLTARDTTGDGDDGTLGGAGGDLPTWVLPAGNAIDLGDDGITYNATSPRQGPNNLQNSPTIVTTADGGLEGWLGGSVPDTTFRVDVYASAGYSPQGAGQAQDYLGSLDVTTDSQGEAVFDVPFSAPEDEPIVTATATDPEGNTSEVSAERRASLEVPTQILRVAPVLPLEFSGGSGDGIAIEDPDAGPFDPEWNFTLSVSSGMLRFASLSGLVGSGNGTSMLQYEGSLSALNAALSGLSYVQAPGTHGVFVLTLAAGSEGAPALEYHVSLSDGVFSVTTTADSGPGSLRQAILDSDAQGGGTNTIAFDIPRAGIQTIEPLSPLPAITNPVLIDGFSQPGYSGTPLIELSGSQVGAGSGLEITGSGSTVRGLEIVGFSEGDGILMLGASADRRHDRSE